jgi:hypothetical protein
LYDLQGPAAFANYDLSASIGPISDADPIGVNNFVNQGTTIGNVTFTSFQDATFTADVIPEPASMAMVALFTGGLYFTRRFFLAV